MTSQMKSAGAVDNTRKPGPCSPESQLLLPVLSPDQLFGSHVQSLCAAVVGDDCCVNKKNLYFLFVSYKISTCYLIIYFITRGKSEAFRYELSED